MNDQVVDQGEWEFDGLDVDDDVIPRSAASPTFGLLSVIELIKFQVHSFRPLHYPGTVSYTHLTLPTNREV